MSPARAPVRAPGALHATARSAVPILMVDDNPSKRLALKAILSPLGHSIVEAETGLEALRCVMAQDFAVILLDVMMPGMDGFETAALIRERWQSEMTPIIFITAHGKMDIRQPLYAEGAVDFIFAPVAPEELRAKVSVFANLFIKAEALAAQASEVQTHADALRLLTDAAPIGIFQTDTADRYTYTNPRWSEITGVSATAAAGRTWRSILDADADGGPAGGPPGQAEPSQRFKLRAPGGDLRIVMVTSEPIPDVDGLPAGWVGTLADVTAEAGVEAAMAEARDQANEASRQKSDFLANMSHEIRTPMNGVIGMTELLLGTDLDARQRDYAQTVRNSGEALMTLLNDILDFSRVESGIIELEVMDFSPLAIVHDVVDLLARTAQNKGLELVPDAGSLLPATVSGDPGRVRQVLTNLIGNAIKFTEAGEVVVRVDASAVAGAGTLVRFEVEDTGEGIAAEKLEDIFNPFVQADSSTSREFGGTGLGLAICGRLVALMGGECGVRSTPGAGSTFWFTIRVATDADRGQATGPAPADEDLAGLDVLVIDHSTAQRRVLSAYLSDWGMNVTAAASGEDAMALLRAAAVEGRPFPVAVLDRWMPGMDGLQVVQAIAADDDLALGVVLMTGLGDGPDVALEREPGLRAGLSKPVHRDQLHKGLHVALGLHAEERASAPMSPATVEANVGRLLLAEDNLINRKVAVAMLSAAGYSVDVVLNGSAAVEAAAQHPYDAILMDCHMPQLNGYEATAAIRMQEGPGRRTPIIAMTAGARLEDRDRCLAHGMDSYLAKPVSKDALLAQIARFVKPGPDGRAASHPWGERAGRPS